MLWNVTAFCVPNSASNFAHLFTETSQVVQETKQHASQCMLSVQQTCHVQEGVQWKQPEKWSTQQQCSCSLSFVCAEISGQYCHDHYPSPTVFLDSSTLCLCPFSINPSWHWRVRDFMTSASFKSSHRLHLQHSKQRTFTDAPISDDLQQMAIKIKLSLVFKNDVLRSTSRLQPIPHSDVYSLQA